MRKYGTRSEVWNGDAQMTRGNLTKDDLIMSSNGRLVSKRKSEAAKKNYEKYGFNKRAEIIVIILALCVFIIFWFFPSLANNSASRWFHDNIMNIEDTPLFGFIFKIIGFFFLLSIFSRMFNAINYLLNSSNLSKNNMGNDNDSSSIGNDDSGEYTDYEEVD